MTVRLHDPNAALLPDYTAALQTGWSPSNTKDLSGEHLQAIAADPAAFLAQYEWAPDQTMAGPDGSPVPRLPGAMRWITQDGTFAGVIGLRYQAGTLTLPDFVSGHVGYAIVPWMRRRGIATAALLALLPLARDAGLHRLLITANPDNTASRRVIEAAGGRLDPHLSNSDVFGPRVGYWVPTA